MRLAKPDNRRRLGTQVTRPGPEVPVGGRTWQPSESFLSDTCKSLLNPVTWCHMYALGTKGETWPPQTVRATIHRSTCRGGSGCDSGCREIGPHLTPHSSCAHGHPVRGALTASRHGVWHSHPFKGVTSDSETGPGPKRHGCLFELE